MKFLYRYIVLILFLTCFTEYFYGQEGYFQFRGRIYNQSNQAISNVKFEVFENSKSIDNYTTSLQGNFILKLKLNRAYVVEISKAGFNTMRIGIDTKVPAERLNDYFDEFTLIILYPYNENDLQAKSGLPSLKYSYKPDEKKFVPEEIGKKSITTNPSDARRIAELQAELENYKKLYAQQKLQLKELGKNTSESEYIKEQADKYADSVIRQADLKAAFILRSAKKDSVIQITILEKTTKEISHDDYKKLSINEKDFINRKNIRELNQKIEKISKQQNLTGRDSLNLKQNRLSIRKELFDMAQYQLQIDKLNARTKEDSMRIEERESQLYLMKQEMLLSEQQLLNVQNELIMKELEIKNKNIMLVSVLIGIVLLLILLGYIYYNYRDKKRINKILEYQNAELEKLSIVASETSNAIIITDEFGNFTWINKGYTRLFGYGQDEVTGENSKCIIGPSNGDKINALIGKARISGEPVNYEFEAKTKSGGKIWVQTTLTPIKNKQGEVTKLIAIDSDISQLKQAESKILRQNVQIMDSINYAKRIQDAMLPADELIKKFFPNSFIYFRPRDIVSGDFYWFSVQDEKLFIAAVDCTGHGVPGAFMSLIGNSLLNHIVNEKKIYSPSEILTELNNGVNLALSHKKQGDDEREDGMDLTLCCFNRDKKEVEISCANHTAIIMNNGQIAEFHGDEISIGETYSKVLNLKFTSQVFPFKENSTFYLFSDGYQDQIGGPKNKKLMGGSFVDLLKETQFEPMNVQIEKLNQKFLEWKGENKQTDDVLVMGIRLDAIS